MFVARIIWCVGSRFWFAGCFGGIRLSGGQVASFGRRKNNVATRGCCGLCPAAKEAKTSRDSEIDEEEQLKATLLALEKGYWEAAGKGDWKVAEKLLADDFFGGYANSSGSGREGKALVIAAVTRRRYSDSTMRNAQVRRISKDTAIVTYVYNCKVEEAGQVWTYRNHQTTRVWTQRDGQWLLIFSEDFILPGGE
jgi:hypothetical protein